MHVCMYACMNNNNMYIIYISLYTYVYIHDKMSSFY